MTYDYPGYPFLTAKGKVFAHFHKKTYIMKNSAKILVFGMFVFLFVACNTNTQNNSTGQNNIVVLSAEDNKAVIEREISTWEFAKNKDFDKLKAIYADDYAAFFGNNTLNSTEAINSFMNAKINNYRMSNIQVKPISNDVVVVYYDLAQDIVGSDGAQWIPNVQSSTVYAKRNGQWRSVFYHEAPDTK